MCIMIRFLIIFIYRVQKAKAPLQNYFMGSSQGALYHVCELSLIHIQMCIRDRVQLTLESQYFYLAALYCSNTAGMGAGRVVKYCLEAAILNNPEHYAILPCRMIFKQLKILMPWYVKSHVGTFHFFQLNVAMLCTTFVLVQCYVLNLL